MKQNILTLFSFALLLQSLTSAELHFFEDKVSIELPEHVIHGRINRNEKNENTQIEINYTKTNLVRGGLVVEKSNHTDIIAYKTDLQKTWSNFLKEPPKVFGNIDENTSLMLWRPGSQGDAVAVLYFGIYDGIEFQLFFLCTDDTKDFQKEIAETINEIASSLVISSKTYKTTILKFQDDLVVLNPEISFHKPESSSPEKKGAELSPQNSTVVKNTASPLKEQEESFPWLLIVGGVFLALLAGSGLFWLLKKPSSS